VAGKVWEFFGYRSDDHSAAAIAAATDKQCPYLSDLCEKRLNDGVIAEDTEAMLLGRAAHHLLLGEFR
jgi:hypothetical protein